MHVDTPDSIHILLDLTREELVALRQVVLVCDLAPFGLYWKVTGIADALLGPVV